MGIPAHWNTAYRYKETLAVTDVQTIINDLYAELVTNGGWTCPAGGIGSSPTTFKSPARADGVYFTVQCTRVSATRIGYVVLDQNGMLVNNQTSSTQDIDAGGTTVHYFTGPLHLCVNTERATPECFACGVLDQSPEALTGAPRASYWASNGPRGNTGTWLVSTWVTNWALNKDATAYSGAARAIPRGCGSTHRRSHANGTWIIEPFEMADSANQENLLGRVFQAVIVPDTIAFAGEVTVPLGDGSSTGVFKVVGLITGNNGRVAFRKV